MSILHKIEKCINFFNYFSTVSDKVGDWLQLLLFGKRENWGHTNFPHIHFLFGFLINLTKSNEIG